MLQSLKIKHVIALRKTIVNKNYFIYKKSFERSYLCKIMSIIIKKSALRHFILDKSLRDTFSLMILENIKIKIKKIAALGQFILSKSSTDTFSHMILESMKIRFEKDVVYMDNHANNSNKTL